MTTQHTGIAWTDATWNPVSGCTKVSEGCRHCYAEAIADRFWGGRKFTDVRCHPDRLDAPLHWRKPRRIFVNSMSDLFHADVPDDFIDRVFGVMLAAAHHTFQVLTKRPERMLEYIRAAPGRAGFVSQWPAQNVWLGVSVENQATADERIPHLLATRAAVRFLSCEPLLGPIDLHTVPWKHGGMGAKGWRGVLRVEGEPDDYVYWEQREALQWVIVGGESGPGYRPMDLGWARALREQCRDARVPFFFKQASAARPGQGLDALGEVVQQFPGGVLRREDVTTGGGD